jgi:hypothetical protein
MTFEFFGAPKLYMDLEYHTRDNHSKFWTKYVTGFPRGNAVGV